MSSRSRRVTWAAAALALTACSGDPGPESVPGGPLPPPVVNEPTTPPGGTVAPTASATATSVDDHPTEPDPAALPPFGPAGTPQTSEHTGAPLLPVTVRVDEHTGFERVVLELAGEGEPGWHVEYVARAVDPGRGDQVEVDGDVVLSVRVTGTRHPAQGEVHPAPQVIDGGDVIEKLHFLGTFEGATQLFVGVDGGLADYRVIPLSDPARLVVDIQDIGD